LRGKDCSAFGFTRDAQITPGGSATDALIISGYDYSSCPEFFLICHRCTDGFCSH